tara:strand:+ start:234 stop:728 length:495 start_codon:yes stop_codon:yes gene_type:complete
MTRQEITGERDLTFSGWVRKNLPDSDTGWCTSDIDWYMYNYKTKKCCIVETKTRNANLTYSQQQMYNNLAKWIGEGAKKDGWKFTGFYIIKFENTWYDDGKVFINGKESSEEEIKKILSFDEGEKMKDKLRKIIEECLDSCTEKDMRDICHTLREIGFLIKENK